MLKRIIVASGLAVLSIDPAGCAQSFGTRQLAGVSTTPGLFASVQACEAQSAAWRGRLRRSRSTTTPSVSTTSA